MAAAARAHRRGAGDAGRRAAPRARARAALRRLLGTLLRDRRLLVSPSLPGGPHRRPLPASPSRPGSPCAGPSSRSSSGTSATRSRPTWSRSSGPCGFWERERRIHRTIRAFSWCYGARYEQIVHPGRFRVEVEGAEHIPDRSRARDHLRDRAPRPMGAVLAPRLARPEAAGARRARGGDGPGGAGFIEGLVRDMSADGVTTHFASDDPRLGIALAEALRRGEIVALQGDRPRAHGRTHTAQLFGRPMPLPVGPQALARATGAALVPVFSFREGPLRLSRGGAAAHRRSRARATGRRTWPRRCSGWPRRSSGRSAARRTSGSACAVSGKERVPAGWDTLLIAIRSPCRRGDHGLLGAISNRLRADWSARSNSPSGTGRASTSRTSTAVVAPPWSASRMSSRLA